jgi:hypothetical protein
VRANPLRLISVLALLGLALLGCNLPSGTASPDANATDLAGTLTVLQTAAAGTQAAGAVAATSTPGATASPTAAISATPQSPLVARDTLCWVGPGNQFEVVSAVHTGAKVELIGQGTISGWYIIRNPIYHDPCWIQASDMQLPPGFNTATLPFFSPPDTPTPVPTDTKVPTATP